MSLRPLISTWLAAGLFIGSLFSAASHATDDNAALPLAVSDIASSIPSLAVKPIGTEWVVYHGIANFDNTGIGGGSLLYPASTAEGFVAAVLTHGLLASAAKQKQKDNLQMEADKVLLPYKPVLETFSSRDLMQRAIAKSTAEIETRFFEEGGSHTQEAVVENQPVFSLTPDQTAIVLDNEIRINLPGRPPKVSYHKSVRIVSAAIKVTDPVAFWTQNEGEKLKDESARLVAESITIAFRDAISNADNGGQPYRTIRYRIGLTEKIERAQILSSRCGHLLIRTLRGTLMSVPAPDTEDAPSPHCADDTHHAQLGELKATSMLMER